jgi:hypothetical protein
LYARKIALKHPFTALILFFLCNHAISGDKFDAASCSFNGKHLYGKIQVVDSFPDVKVQIVGSFPQLRVKKVNAFPDSCGEWQMVTSFPDTKIQFVNSFPDVRIQYVDAFPGAD